MTCYVLHLRGKNVTNPIINCRVFFFTVFTFGKLPPVFLVNYRPL